MAGCLLVRAAMGPVDAQIAGPVAAYGFNEGTGTAFGDASGNNNSGSLSGATWAPGRFGTAVLFDGVDDLASIADSASLDLTAGMTLEAWVYPQALSGWRTILLKERSGHLAYALYGNTDLSSPSGEISTSAAGAVARGSSRLPLNVWTHVAATYDGTTVRLFVNGVLAGSGAANGSILTSGDPLRIGGNTVWGEYFAGRIDEVRVYNRALSAAELQADMDQPVAIDTSTPTVTAVTPFDGAAEVSTGSDVSAVFSKDMKPATITTATVTVRDASGELVPSSVTYDAPSRQARLDPDSRLEPTASYTARIAGGPAGVRDAAGNAMDADMAWTFTTTADVDTPIVVSRSPAPGAITVATTVDIVAAFNEAVQRDSVVFVLRDSSSDVVPATVTYDESTLTASLRPSAALAPSSSYTATVERALDLAGNPMSAPVAWVFTTGFTGFLESIVFTGLVEPTAVEFASDGRVFVAEKSGLIKVFDSLTDTTPTIFADLRTNVHNFWDRGLLGMALDPTFPARPYVYVLYTHDAAIGGTAPRWGTAGGTSDPCPDPPGATADGCVVSGRLSRLQESGNVQDGPEQVLIEDWAQQFPSHSIGSIAFGADGYLYASGGDGASFNFVDYGQGANPLADPVDEGGALRSQDLQTSGDPVTLAGSIVRLDPATGEGAPDNPLSASTDVNARRIIASGLRNPFRFAFRPGTSELYIGDVGPGGWEEINRVDDAGNTALENFGWPCYEGVDRQAGYEAAGLGICENLYNQADAVVVPFSAYQHGVKIGDESCPAGSSSISGLAFYGGGNYPASYQGALFFADYSRGCIWVMYADAGGPPDPSRIATFRAGAAAPVQLQIGPQGDLFYVDVGGTIRRIRYVDGNRPPQADAMASPAAGHAPLTVTFDGSGSADPDAGDALTYAWDLDGDGFFDNGSSAAAGFTYTTSGVYTARLQVTDSQGLSDIRALVITANGFAPEATIDAPSSFPTWAAGDTIAFAGTGTDPEEGPLAPSAFSWSLVMQHCAADGSCHPHPLQTYAGVQTGSFTAPDHEYPSYLELELTVTDSSGLADVERVRLDPTITELTFESVPAGLTLAVGSDVGVTPFTRTVIVGSTNSVSAPSPQALDSTSYQFQSWTDGRPATHTIVASTAPATYRATYAAIPSLSIMDGSAIEADSPGAAVSLTVTLSASSERTVTVDYATMDGTAAAGVDYTVAAGTLSFPPGTMSQSIDIQIAGDALDEPDEIFRVALSNPAEGGLADGAGTATIVDNDSAPSVRVDDVQLPEGSGGTTPATFTVSLSAASGLPVTIQYATAPGTATAGADYVTTSGTLEFAPGVTTATVTVFVAGDAADEPDETFVLNLSGAVNAALPDPLGAGLIRDDDEPGLPGLVAAYGFNEGTGTVVSDVSPNRNGGVLSGAVWVDGRMGRGLSFDGVNDLVTIAASSSLDLTGGMTLEAWVYPRTVSGWRTVVLKPRPGNVAYGLSGSTSNGRPSAEVAVGPNREVRGPSSLPLNTWSHLAATYDGAHIRLYVNGGQVASVAATGTIFQSTSPLHIGGNLSDYFNGVIDEIRIYNRPLTPAEIQTDMNTPVGGPFF
jgi:glucose/arabinose dehydrogenase